ncbi:MAG TPA: FUSC family membrane protein [Edaphocola sp.]|nr:FUSC family membrane protein [Edaphocola sp.]
MNKIPILIIEQFKTLHKFLKSISFSRATLIGIAVAFPIVLGIQFGYFEIGLALSLGAFWCSPSDISGSFRQKKMGILFSAALVTLVSFIGGYLHFETWGSLPILAILGFGISFISVYGFRASLISFSGLLALALSFAYDLEDLKIYQNALLIGVGGLWYLLLAKIWHHINPKAETEEFLSETYVLTADFIEIRGKLVNPNEDHQKLQSQLQNLQGKLTENHETLREILILTRMTSGWSNYQDNRLLVFAQLVEMLETAIANPGNYVRMNTLFNEHPQFIKLFQDLIFKMSIQLRMISEMENGKNRLPEKDDLQQCFEEIKSEIVALREDLNYENYLMLQNLLEYQEKQFEKLKRIKWLLGEPNTTEIDFIDRKKAKRFVAPQEYDPIILVQNFSFKSSIFRHSLRLAVTIMIGYTMGSLFPLQNPYWILLTIIVIMRPSYGLTKSRAKDRTIGTLIGGTVAFGMVFLTLNPYVYGALGIISLIISFALIQKNAKASAVFITLSVVFIYAILQPDILTVIKFRILDTIVGAGLSYMAMRWLWPTWEFLEINESIRKTVKANMNFLQKITELYLMKGKVPTSYNIARKYAFLETSNLNSAFQRMVQEPKSKQNEINTNYELLVLNHNFLASLASLSTYIKHHKTTKASEQFKNAIDKIEQKLGSVLQCLKDTNYNKKKFPSEQDPGFEENWALFNTFNITNLTSQDNPNERDFQEAHLVWEHLQWLYSISNKMLKLVALP